MSFCPPPNFCRNQLHTFCLPFAVLLLVGASFTVPCIARREV